MSNINISGITNLHNILNLLSLSKEQINNLINPINGNIIFNNNTNRINIYSNNKWVEVLDNSYININGTSIFNSYVSINSTLNSNQINSDLVNANLLNSNILNTNELLIINDTTCNNSLLVNNELFTNNIQSYNSLPLNIKGDVINIGDINSCVNIMGTATYIATVNLSVQDKLILLNLDEHNNALDIGMDSGVLIAGNKGYGYIKTNEDATRFIIKTPIKNDYDYIATLDQYNNLHISGKTMLLDQVSINSNLNISGYALFNSEVFVNNDINIIGEANFYDYLNVHSELNVLGSSILNNGTILTT
jgi:hypothetical protein